MIIPPPRGLLLRRKTFSPSSSHMGEVGPSHFMTAIMAMISEIMMEL